MRPGQKWWLRCFLSVISGTGAPPHSHTRLIVPVNNDPEQTCLFIVSSDNAKALVSTFKNIHVSASSKHCTLNSENH